MDMVHKMNENQKKHVANSLRMIGVGQFALYGLKEFKLWIMIL